MVTIRQISPPGIAIWISLAHTQRSPSKHAHQLHEWLNCLQPHASERYPNLIWENFEHFHPWTCPANVSIDTIPTYTSNITISRWEDAFPVWVMHPLTTRILHQQQSSAKHSNITQNCLQHQNNSKTCISTLKSLQHAFNKRLTACSQSNYLLILLTPSYFNYCPTLALTSNSYPLIFIWERYFI